LHRTRTQAVFGAGCVDADLMFVGEAPGKDEDLSGKPFVGRAGGLLTRMIEAMGFTRDDVFIANVLKCRPPENRTPTPEEIALCLPYLKKQVARIRPRVIVALGSPAAKTLLATGNGIMSLRGRVYPCAFDQKVRVVPTFHPAYLLRKEAEKPKAWQDLKRALKVLAGEED
jgi:DNA polymerase